MNPRRYPRPPISVLRDPTNAGLFDELFEMFAFSAHKRVEARHEGLSADYFDAAISEYPQLADALHDIRAATERRASEYLQRHLGGKVEDCVSHHPITRRAVRWRIALRAFLNNQETFRNSLAVNEIWGCPAYEAQEWRSLGDGMQTRDQIIAGKEQFEERLRRALPDREAEDIEFQWHVEDDEVEICVSIRGFGRGRGVSIASGQEPWVHRKTGTVSYDPHRGLLRARADKPIQLHMLLDALPTLARTDEDVEMPLEEGQVVDVGTVLDESFRLTHYFDDDITSVAIRELRLEQASHGDPNREELSPWSITINDNQDAINWLKVYAPRLHSGGARIGHLKLIMKVKDGAEVVATLEPPTRVLVSDARRFDQMSEFLIHNGFIRDAGA